MRDHPSEHSVLGIRDEPWSTLRGGGVALWRLSNASLRPRCKGQTACQCLPQDIDSAQPAPASTGALAGNLARVAEGEGGMGCFFFVFAEGSR